jgi:hypothetical protein
MAVWQVPDQRNLTYFNVTKELHDSSAYSGMYSKRAQTGKKLLANRVKSPLDVLHW